ncbi:MAG: ABC transporter ATP-binding protein [Rhodospirillaceae bacterium]|nr:ABC transporter ATP-binding protein [Rhodospirillaceae bacterium]
MLKLENVHKAFGGVIAVDHVTLDFAPGSLSAIIGPNGAGKTTLFNLISGRIKPDGGRVVLDGEDIAGVHATEIVRRGIGRAFQVASIFPTLTVSEALTGAVLSHRRRTLTLAGRFHRSGLDERVSEIMTLTGLEAQADTLSANLSHGDQKLLDIALAIALEPKLLLLDEPTAGMGPDERWLMIERVQALWRTGGMTLIFIEHDMDIVFKIAQTIRVLKYGAVLAEGPPAAIRENPEVIEAYLGAPAEETAS